MRLDKRNENVMLTEVLKDLAARAGMRKLERGGAASSRVECTVCMSLIRIQSLGNVGAAAVENCSTQNHKPSLVVMQCLSHRQLMTGEWPNAELLPFPVLCTAHEVLTFLLLQ
jgi:hypothetical protein